MSRASRHWSTSRLAQRSWARGSVASLSAYFRHRITLGLSRAIASRGIASGRADQLPTRVGIDSTAALAAAW